jgi:hypothetical protein
MTMLRRAPREVYRVYEEEEFFACADREERSEAVGASVRPVRRLHRLVGATMLLTAAGALGALMAIAGPSSVAGVRRRAGGRLLAASGPPVSSRVARGQIWSARAGSDWQSGTAVKERRVVPMREVGGDRPASGRPMPISRHEGVSRRPAVATDAGSPAVVGVAAMGSSRAPIELASAASAPPAGAMGSARPSGQSEFGFER